MSLLISVTSRQGCERLRGRALWPPARITLFCRVAEQLGTGSSKTSQAMRPGEHHRPLRGGAPPAGGNPLCARDTQGGSSKAMQATGPRLVLRALLPLQQRLPALQPTVSEKGAQRRQRPGAEPGPAVHGRPRVTPRIRASPPSPQGTHSSFQHQINRNQCGWRGATGRQHPLSLGVVREGFKEEFQCAMYRMRSQGFPNESCITAKAASRHSCQPSTI